MTEEIFQLLQDLQPNKRMYEFFLTIIYEGINNEFVREDNWRWNLKASPIVEAYFHAKHILELMVRYIKNRKNACPGTKIDDEVAGRLDIKEETVVQEVIKNGKKHYHYTSKCKHEG